MRWVFCAALVVSAAGCKKSSFLRGPEDVPPDFLSTNCKLDVECDDGNPCTMDSCSTLDNTCTNTAKDCSAVKDNCNSASCDMTTGDCVGVPRNEGHTCMDP